MYAGLSFSWIWSVRTGEFMIRLDLIALRLLFIWLWIDGLVYR